MSHGTDSLEWLMHQDHNIAAATVSAGYGLFINNLTAGMFNAAGGITPTYKLNNFTIQEAVKFKICRFRFGALFSSVET